MSRFNIGHNKRRGMEKETGLLSRSVQDKKTRCLAAALFTVITLPALHSARRKSSTLPVCEWRLESPKFMEIHTTTLSNPEAIWRVLAASSSTAGCTAWAVASLYWCVTSLWGEMTQLRPTIVNSLVRQSEIPASQCIINRSWMNSCKPLKRTFSRFSGKTKERKVPHHPSKMSCLGYGEANTRQRKNRMAQQNIWDSLEDMTWRWPNATTSTWTVPELRSMTTYFCDSIIFDPFEELKLMLHLMYLCTGFRIFRQFVKKKDGSTRSWTARGRSAIEPLYFQFFSPLETIPSGISKWCSACKLSMARNDMVGWELTKNDNERRKYGKYNVLWGYIRKLWRAP